eukprot:TRINITY_DN8702_c0_g2_i1.p4 TRINITY_DN8702_c0_g2~~TRINITY_DN8702_c0_g2_i1.p4  ORF type:complete len:225 (-),score=28.12 TRINITY_DN8702_c0_g2_i1:1326-2000(-)
MQFPKSAQEQQKQKNQAMQLSNSNGSRHSVGQTLSQQSNGSASFTQRTSSNELAACVRENLAWVYVKKSDFDRFIKAVLQCDLDPSKALYGIVVADCHNQDQVSLYFVDECRSAGGRAWYPVSDGIGLLNILDIELDKWLAGSFLYQQQRGFSRRATKLEIFQTLQRIIKMDAYDRFNDGSQEIKQWLQQNLFAYEAEIDEENSPNSKFTMNNLKGLEAEQLNS